MANPIIQRKEKIFDDAELLLTDNLGATQREIYQSIYSLIADFDTRDGKFLNTDRNVRLLNTITARIQAAVESTEYTGRVTEYLRQFNRLESVNAALQQSVNSLDISGLNLTNIQRQAQSAVIYDLLGNGMQANLAEPVRKLLTKSIFSGMGTQEFAAGLRQFIVKDGEMIGRVNVGQIARDAILQYDGTINTIIFNEFGLDEWGYEGSIIKDSRPQCRRWVKMGRIAASELPEEIAWAEANGSGLIPETTPENFAINRGGYNCRHTATPLRKLPK